MKYDFIKKLDDYFGDISIAYSENGIGYYGHKNQYSEKLFIDFSEKEKIKIYKEWESYISFSSWSKLGDKEILTIEKEQKTYYEMRGKNQISYEKEMPKIYVTHLKRPFLFDKTLYYREALSYKIHVGLIKIIAEKKLGNLENYRIDFKKNNKQLSIIEFSPKKKVNKKERRR